MITGLICVILFIAMYCAGSNGEWGSVAVGVVLVLLLIGLCSTGKKADRAYGNFIDHWEKRR